MSLEVNVGLQGFLRSYRFLQLSLAKPLESYAVDFLFHGILSSFCHSKRLGSGKVWVPFFNIYMKFEPSYANFETLLGLSWGPGADFWFKLS